MKRFPTVAVVNALETRGFKLDFDGPLISIFSRFYPPKTHYGDKWDGAVTVFVLKKQVLEEKFECDSLGELKSQVEGFFQKLSEKAWKIN